MDIAKSPEEGAVVVFSGGQDSTTCLFWAKRKFGKVYALTFSYGQKHSVETEAAERIAAAAGVEFTLMDASFIGKLSVNSLTDATVAMDSEVPDGGFPNTFVPGRNMFFLGIAGVFAREKGIRHIVTGVSQADFSGYPDCRDAFVRSMNLTMNLAMDTQFEIHTPLMRLDKCGVWALADELGVLELVRRETVTCYNGVPGDGCGSCPACKLRNAGLAAYLETKK